MFGLLSVNGYILACGCSVLIAVAIYFWITRFPNYQEVSQDEIDKAEAMYEEIKQAQQDQQSEIKINPKLWEWYKEVRSNVREEMSRQSLN